MDREDTEMNAIHLNINKETESAPYFLGHTNPVGIDLIDDICNNKIANESTRNSIGSSKTRNVRIIHCGDGVVEECDEDDAEKKRLEEEEKQRQLEVQKILDEQAVNTAYYSMNIKNLNLILLINFS
jgi:hypothetical protein